MLKKKYSLESPKIYLEELKSPLTEKKKRVINTKEKENLVGIKPGDLSNPSKKIRPFVFKRNRSPIKTISFINNDTGKMRHFTPAAQEWYNSIYSYNNNYIKLLPSTDKNVIKLLRSYFNFFANNKILKTKRITKKYRKLSTNKVFVGKGELKHTSNKVIITSYVYNVEQLYLKSLVRKEAKSMYYPYEELKRYTNIDINKKNVRLYDRPFTLHEYLNIYNKPLLPNHEKLHKKLCFSLFWKQYIKLIGINELKEEQNKNREKEKKFDKKYGGKKEGNVLLEFVKFRMIYLDPVLNNNAITSTIIKDLISSTMNNNNSFIDIKNINFNELKFKDQIEVIFLRDFYSVNDNTSYQNFINPLLQLVGNKKEEKLIEFKEQVLKIRKIFDSLDVYMAMTGNNYFKKFYRFSYLLMLSTAKFKTPFLSKLLYLLKNAYKKNVELNIVNINKVHLNSDIYTQVIAKKLKNRSNRLASVLKRSLSKVELPNVSRMTEKLNISDRDDYLINKIRNTYINTMFNNIDVDPLNNLLLRFFTDINDLKINTNNKLSTIKRPISLYKYIIRSLKHVKLAGIRIEAKGRLTRRFTASRSVFSLAWKGGLKNVDSSFKGLSTIMLRGDRKSNVQYSMLSSKNRIGAYGLKGWVSSK